MENWIIWKSKHLKSDLLRGWLHENASHRTYESVLHRTHESVLHRTYGNPYRLCESRRCALHVDVSCHT